MSAATMKRPEIPDEVIEEIAGLAGIEEPDRIASLGRRLRSWIASSSVQIEGFQTTESGVVVGNRHDIKAAGRISKLTERLLRELENASPNLVQQLLFGAAATRAYGPPSWAGWQEAIATLNGQAFAARDDLSDHNSKHLRTIRAMFWIAVDVAVSECGGRLTFSETGNSSLAAAKTCLHPYLPPEIGDVSVRTIWNAIKRSGVNKHRK